MTWANTLQRRGRKHKRNWSWKMFPQIHHMVYSLIPICLQCFASSRNLPLSKLQFKHMCEATCNRTLLTSVCCKCEARNPWLTNEHNCKRKLYVGVSAMSFSWNKFALNELTYNFPGSSFPHHSTRTRFLNISSFFLDPTIQNNQRKIQNNTKSIPPISLLRSLGPLCHVGRQVCPSGKMGIVLMVAHTAACTTTVAINSHNIHLLPIRSACMMTTKDYLLFWMCLVTPSLNLQFMHVCDGVQLRVPNARRISSRAWSPPVPSDTSLSSKRKQVPSWCLGCRFCIFGDTLSSMQASAKVFT